MDGRSLKRLLVWRHAKAESHDVPKPDFERSLTARGRRDAARAADWIIASWGAPDAVLCSPARRTVQTLQALPAHARAGALIERSLYAAGIGELFDALRGVDPAAETALIVGHNPSVHQLANALPGAGAGNARLAMHMPTAAVAALEFVGEWAALVPGGAALAAYFDPREG